MNSIQAAALRRFPPKKADLRPGDTVRAHIQIQEGEKSRLQIFEGVVLKIQGHAMSRSLTVRKISHGVGVEKTLPLSSPRLQHVEVTARAKVRRARLFYLRERKGREARLKAKAGPLPMGDSPPSRSPSAEPAPKGAGASAPPANRPNEK